MEICPVPETGSTSDLTFRTALRTCCSHSKFGPDFHLNTEAAGGSFKCSELRFHVRTVMYVWHAEFQSERARGVGARPVPQTATRERVLHPFSIANSTFWYTHGCMGMRKRGWVLMGALQLPRWQGERSGLTLRYVRAGVTTSAVLLSLRFCAPIPRKLGCLSLDRLFPHM
jgi:hypothetical protein